MSVNRLGMLSKRLLTQTNICSIAAAVNAIQRNGTDERFRTYYTKQRWHGNTATETRDELLRTVLSRLLLEGVDEAIKNSVLAF